MLVGMFCDSTCLKLTPKRLGFCRLRGFFIDAFFCGGRRMFADSRLSQSSCTLANEKWIWGL